VCFGDGLAELVQPAQAHAQPLVNDRLRPLRQVVGQGLPQFLAVSSPVATLARHLSQSDHHPAGVNVVGAMLGAVFAPQAEPDIAAGEQPFGLAELDHAQGAIRPIVHSRDDWATSRALVAVVAELDGLAAECVDLVKKASHQGLLRFVRRGVSGRRAEDVGRSAFPNRA
jgi:hypothetical protein